MNSVCPVCKKDCSRTALTKLVFSFEPVDNELIETTWHKSCFGNRENKFWVTEMLEEEQAANGEMDDRTTNLQIQQ